MGRSGVFRFLLVANAVLVSWLACNLYLRNQATAAPVTVTEENKELPPPEKKNAPGAVPSKASKSNSEATPFAQVYSTDPKKFAENLKAIQCPEQTIRDIISAEVHRRFKAQEESLRPTPADHVPFAWSARTTERRLLERRQEAAELARDEAAILRESFGCDATVPVPIYAMTSSDLQFETQVSANPALDTCGVRQVHDTYWSDVQALLQRTKGFWLPEDLAELQALKDK